MWYIKGLFSAAAVFIVVISDYEGMRPMLMFGGFMKFPNGGKSSSFYLVKRDGSLEDSSVKLDGSDFEELLISLTGLKYLLILLFSDFLW